MQVRQTEVDGDKGEVVEQDGRNCHIGSPITIMPVSKTIQQPVLAILQAVTDFEGKIAKRACKTIRIEHRYRLSQFKDVCMEGVYENQLAKIIGSANWRQWRILKELVASFFSLSTQARHTWSSVFLCA